MPFHDQSQFDVRCEWGPGGVRHLAPADVTIIVDVLSFTTTVDVAVGRGATVFPYRWKDDAAADHARGHRAELAARRRDATVGYSLAPSSLVNAPADLRLVLPSPNGSALSFEAMESGAAVVAGCLRNASAVARWAGRHGRRFNVIPAGERWPDGSVRPAFEDLVGAGAILRQLPGRRSPEAQAAIAAFEGCDPCNALRHCSSGRELIEASFAADVEIAAAHDVSQAVPVLANHAFVAAGD